MLGGGGHRTIATVLTARDDATSKLNRVERAGDDVAESASEAEQRIEGLSTAFAATGTATAVLGGSVALLTQRFSRLGKTFQTIQTTSGATAEEMQQIRGAAKDISSTLPVTLSESAQAMRSLSFAGLSASESISAIRETSELAVAAQMQTSQAADIVAQSMNAFNLEAEQADAIVGSLGSTFSNSTTRVRELAQALTEVQSTAASAGLSVAGTVGALGTLADNGIQASKAGTSLNAVLSRLAGNSSQTQKALEELGLSTSDFTNEAGELQDITTIVGTLSERMEDASQAEQIRLAQQIGGREGARALLPLIRQTDKLEQKVRDNLRAEIQGAIGDLAEMGDEELETTSQALGMEVSGETSTQELVSNLQALDSQGESTEEIVSRLQVGLGLTGQAAEELATEITETNKSAEEIADAIGGVMTAAELAEDQTKTLSGQIEQLRSSFQVLGYEMYQGTKPAVSAVVGGLQSLATPLSQNTAVARALGVGLIGLTGAAAVATGALGALIVNLKIAQLQTSVLTQQTATYNALTRASTAATLAKNKALWLATASTGQLAAATRAKTAAMWTSITGLYSSATAALADASAKGVATAATGALATGFVTLQAAMGPIGWLLLGIAGAAVALAAIWKGDLFGAGEEAGNLLGWFGDKAGTAWNVTKQLTGILFELARIGATIAGLSLIAPFAAVLKLPDLISSVGPKVKKAAMSLPGKIADGLASLGPAKYALPVLGPLLLAKDMITDPSKWLDAGKQIPGMIANGIKSAASKPVDAVTNVASGIRDRLPFSPAEKGPLQSLGETGPGLIQTIAGGVESEAPTLVSSISNVLGQTPLGQAAGAAGGLLGKTPLGQAAGAAADAIGGSGEGGDSGGPGGGSGEGMPRLEITINQDIDVDGGDATEADVATAASDGASEAISGDALDAFFQQLAREVNN
ncbi:TP901 family phage tail tape measure protein [Haloarcula quadrata]|uniref:TP901 family phage tail tape measure protein n=1 Tax=Haloarcula quadrata TaxID=182779 RepID=A0A495R7S4_9EURY|nr:phage tail tape measure protein [Haloarcula quadrata]RKS83322.1 TP901 family phage tail tape measure protein [Haloarcula quadrata]